MVDRAQLFRVADEIHAEGRVPSQRLIRERLAGSFSDIGPLYTAWCVERHVRPRPTKDDLPKAFGDRLATLAAAIWCDGVTEGNKAALNERDALEVERNALRGQLTEALATLDALEKQVAFLEEDRAERAARQRRRAEEFWDRVMLEIVEILGADTLHAVTIVERLSAETRREAAGFQDGIEPSRIADKMRTRINHKKYFEETKKNVFRQRAAPSRAAVPVEAPPLAAAPTDAAPESQTSTEADMPGRTPSTETAPEVAPGPPQRPSLRGLAMREDDVGDEAMERARYTASGQPIASSRLA